MSQLTPPRIISVPECSKYSSKDYDESRAAQFDPRDPASLRVRHSMHDGAHVARDYMPGRG